MHTHLDTAFQPSIGNAFSSSGSYSGVDLKPDATAAVAVAACPIS